MAGAIERWENQAAHAGVPAALQRMLTICAPAPLLWDVAREAPDDGSICGGLQGAGDAGSTESQRLQRADTADGHVRENLNPYLNLGFADY